MCFAAFPFLKDCRRPSQDNETVRRTYAPGFCIFDLREQGLRWLGLCDDWFDWRK